MEEGFENLLIVFIGVAELEAGMGKAMQHSMYQAYLANSGLDNTWKLTPALVLAFKMLMIEAAALTGTVLFSTTILFSSLTSAIRRAQDSTNWKINSTH